MMELSYGCCCLQAATASHSRPVAVFEAWAVMSEEKTVAQHRGMEETAVQAKEGSHQALPMQAVVAEQNNETRIMKVNSIEASEESPKKQASSQAACAKAKSESTQEKDAAHSKPCDESQVRRRQLQIQSDASECVLSEAWTGQQIDAIPTPSVPPLQLCLAVFSKDDIHYTAMLLRQVT